MLIQSARLDDVLALLSDISCSEQDSLFIGLGEQCGVSAPDLVAELRKTRHSFFGGVFPGVIWGGRKYEKGCVVAKVRGTARPLVIPSISSGEEDIAAPCRRLARGSVRSVMLFVDGLSANISHLLQEVGAIFGPSVRVFGGGAGSLSLRRFPVVFTMDGVFEDAAVMLPMESACCLGVRHGWQTLSGPYVANEAEGNVLKQINFREALSFYRELIESDSGQTLLPEHFYKLAMRYPLGIHVADGEPIVRDPLMISPEGYLVCCGDIDKGSVISVLKGSREALIEAAGAAADDCLSRAQGHKVTHAFIVDCISRVSFLDDYFERELDVINSKLALAVGGPEPMGILTLGEIATHEENGPSLFNKTTVLAVLQ